MKISNPENLIRGQVLTLKPARAQAYSLESQVEFIELVLRKGYKVPFIRAISVSGGLGIFKPSDFK